MLKKVSAYTGEIAVSRETLHVTFSSEFLMNST